MRRTYERGAKARLSFSGGPHAPVNMADSMENAGSWTVSESKEAMETWRTKYTAVQRSKRAISCDVFTDIAHTKYEFFNFFILKN